MLTWITFLSSGFFPATSFVFPHFRCILESYSQHSINASKIFSGTSYRPKTILFLNFSHRLRILILGGESWLLSLTWLNQHIRATGQLPGLYLHYPPSSALTSFSARTPTSISGSSYSFSSPIFYFSGTPAF